MNLISHESHPPRPFEPGVYMVTGVNGVGKSTIVDAITEGRPEAIPLHASHELRGLFNGISREELEGLSPEEKLSRMVCHFTSVFERELNDDKAVVMDTHLLVPIRKEDQVTYEDIWSNEYKPYVSSMVMLSTDPESIRQWRIADEEATGRRRNTDVVAIAADQDKNVTRFNELRESGDIPAASTVLDNKHGRIVEAQIEVERVFLLG